MPPSVCVCACVWQCLAANSANLINRINHLCSAVTVDTITVSASNTHRLYVRFLCTAGDFVPTQMRGVTALPVQGLPL